MKKAFISTVCELMEKDENVYLFTADLGFGVMNRVIDEHPDKFVNLGICEQNMASAAAGMALEGNTVFTYSIGNFPTMRCLEQIRNDVAYHKANVKIVAVGGGFSYGNLGMSHHATEDIAIMRAIPGMTVLSPADSYETSEAVKLAKEINGPVYIRLGRGGEPDIPHFSSDITKVMAVTQTCSFRNELPSVAVCGSGTILSEIVSASETIGNSVNLSCYSIPLVKPADKESIIDICSRNDYVVTVEEHNIIGGLGSLFAEIIAENQLRSRIVRIGMKDEFTSVVGSPAFLRHHYGLDCEGITRAVKAIAEGKG